MEAAAIASVDGIEETARALRLDRGRLEVVVSEVSEVSEGSEVSEVDGGRVRGTRERGGSGFVELDVRALVRGGDERCVVEMVHRVGHRLRIEGEASGLDLAALTRAFIREGSS